MIITVIRKHYANIMETTCKPVAENAKPDLCV